MTTQEKVNLRQAWLDNKPLEFSYVSGNGQWTPCRKFLGGEDDLQWDWSLYNFRIKPEPKKIPFTRETIPLRAIFKYKEDVGSNHWYLISHLNSVYVVLSSNRVDYSVLAADYLYSTDNGVTWCACHQSV